MRKSTYLVVLWQQERNTVEEALICPFSMGCVWPIPILLHILGNALSFHRGGPEPGFPSCSFLAGYLGVLSRQHIYKWWLCPLPWRFLEWSPGTPPILSWQTFLIPIGRWPRQHWCASSRVLFTMRLPILSCGLGKMLSQRGCVMSGARGRPFLLRIIRLLSRPKSKSTVM